MVAENMHSGGTGEMKIVRNEEECLASFSSDDEESKKDKLNVSKKIELLNATHKQIKRANKTFRRTDFGPTGLETIFIGELDNKLLETIRMTSQGPFHNEKE